LVERGWSCCGICSKRNTMKGWSASTKTLVVASTWPPFFRGSLAWPHQSSSLLFEQGGRAAAPC
jgi:hypothetical protein